MCNLLVMWSAGITKMTKVESVSLRVEGSREYKDRRTGRGFMTRGLEGLRNRGINRGFIAGMKFP